MEKEKTFKIKNGFCHITPEKIIITKDGNIGEVSEKKEKGRFFKIALLYSLVSIYLLYKAYRYFDKGDLWTTLFYGVFALLFIFILFISRNNSSTPVIERKNIKKVKFTNGKSGYTRARFEIVFDENGTLKRRFIMLPGSLNDGENETKKALAIMKEENLLVTV